MFKQTLVLLVVIISTGKVWSQGVAVNTTAAQADGSAMLDIAASNKGLLIPRLSTTQRDLVLQPATALLIFNSDVKQFQVNTGTPAAPVWQNITASGGSSSWGTGGNLSLTDTAFLGTLDSKPLVMKTNNVLRLYIDSLRTRVGIGTNTPKTSLEIAATDAIILPVGTTAQRPPQPVVGMIRFNSTSGKLEGYTTGGWVALH